MRTGEHRGTRFQTIGHASATAYGTVITAHATPGLKSGAAELVAAASNLVDSVGMIVTIVEASGPAKFAVDIRYGASLDYSVVPDILFEASVADANGQSIYVPVSVPAGTRIGARCSSTVGSATVNVAVTLVAGGLGATAGCYVNSYGNGAGAGQSVDPGTTINTKGAWAELVQASQMTRSMQWGILLVHNQVNTAPLTSSWRIDIGIGAAASEQVVVPDILIRSYATFDNLWPAATEFDLCLPAGTRIAVRAQSTTGAAVDRLIDVALIACG